MNIDPAFFDRFTHRLQLLGRNYDIADHRWSLTPKQIEEDINRGIFFLDDLKDPKVIFDIGANVGILSIVLADWFPDAKIYAFEPLVFNADAIRHNAKVNGVGDRIEVVETAIWSHSQSVALQFPLWASGEASISFDKPTDKLFPAIVPSMTLTQAFNRYAPAGVDYFKMDIEGAEFEVLKGFNQWNLIKKLHLELHNQHREWPLEKNQAAQIELMRDIKEKLAPKDCTFQCCDILYHQGKEAETRYQRF